MLRTCIAVGFPAAELNALLLVDPEKLSVVGFADDLEEAKALLKERVPDAVVAYALKEGAKAGEYLEAVSRMNPAPAIVFAFRSGNATVPDGIKAIDCSKGYSDVIGALSEPTKSAEREIRINRERALDERIANIFISAGIPPHIKGYQFLREAVKQTVDVPEMINNITKELYPAVARHFNTSPSKVERAIRHAIEVAWSRGKIENINNIYGIKIFARGEKPTNGELIALVADKLIIEYSV